jgi:hypothetical protein
MSAIVNDLITYLQDELSMRGHRGMKFLHEINDFPSFYIHAGGERFVHIGGGQRLAIISCDARIYNYSDNLEDIEKLLRRFEEATQRYFDERADEFRIVEVSTDEGLMSPNQISDIKLEILYRKIK